MPPPMTATLILSAPDADREVEKIAVDDAELLMSAVATPIRSSGRGAKSGRAKAAAEALR